MLFKCPICGQTTEHLISNINQEGFSCSRCGDKISYPNRFMFNLLQALGVNFKPEAGFPWCKYPSLTNPNIYIFGRYDFAIKDSPILIEMDGGLGHGHILHSKSKKSMDELIYIDKMKSVLAQKNGYDIIRIDCSYKGRADKFSICKQSIENSRFTDYYDLSNIDWAQINPDIYSNLIRESSLLYKQGLTTKEISKILNRSQCTIIDYLHKADAIGFCNFTRRK